MAKLFEPLTIKNITLKNRIVMSPMCMFSVKKEDGLVTPFHITHYESRAVGGTGLVMIEATAIEPRGRIQPTDLGIWSDEHIDGLHTLTDRIHAHGAHAAIQLGHAGNKAKTTDTPIAPSSEEPAITAMTPTMIDQLIDQFKVAAIRARKAGFDIIELHAAHGYLLNQFLSPLSNKRTDLYGGTKENRYRIVQQVIDAVKSVFHGPIFVRISADEYHEDGNTAEDFIYFSQEMKDQGVDLIDVSTGGLVNAAINVFPGYQVSHAEMIKQGANILTGAVGMITEAKHAEEILNNNRADLIFIGRELLRNPYWPRAASEALDVNIDAPTAYKRGWT
ncbi:NADPH2 dehydrogenase [Halolactibacillus halophilus]|uniref:NADPH dehydrogenase n=1 Tax=Halolactibacillus halophilus TaxID=306540 RepID=A0A1I5P866_9BACI|nr:NADPH dehydrogenase NamA [Halolactibacillus halophilus]GEM01692.1 NADPH dehydrogenase [Halolactibacillus halophilus]SFP29731.1 NADPH2 dehydrogenase [Halolactibacillus halophilus]